MNVPPPQPDPKLLIELKKGANERDKTKAEVRAKDADTAASLVATAKAAFELGVLINNPAMTQFASDLAEESDHLARGVMAEAAHEGGETPQEETNEYPDGQDQFQRWAEHPGTIAFRAYLQKRRRRWRANGWRGHPCHRRRRRRRWC